MLIARPAGVFLSLWPYRFSVREKLFISWVGLRGAVGFFLASMPLLVGLKNAQIYFDVGFIVVLVSLLVQGWTIAPAARWLRIAKKRLDVFQPRIELDLPGQRSQELVGYPVTPGSPYLRERYFAVLGEARAGRARREGDDAGGSAWPARGRSCLSAGAAGKGQLRSTASSPICRRRRRPIRELLGDFFIGGDATLGALSEIYGITVEPSQHAMTVAELFDKRLGRAPHPGDSVRIGDVALVVHRVKDDHGGHGRLAACG